MERIKETFLIRASEILADMDEGLTWNQIIEYSNIYSKKYNREIPYDRYPNDAPNKRTALKENLEVFSSSEQCDILINLCDCQKLRNKALVQELKQEIIEKYGHLMTGGHKNAVLLFQAKQYLENYPEVFNLFESAVNKYENGIYERNALDDMRLSFEILLKRLLANEKSLENQLNMIGTKLKEVGISPELRNMVHQLVKYYCDFQNHYVKHDDAVNKIEIEYVIEQTHIMMKFLVKCLGGVA